MAEPRIDSMALHYVGNQANEKPMVLSDKLFALSEDMNSLLTDYFIGSFKSEARFHFHDDMGLENNRVYRLVSDIFDNPGMLLDFSRDIATHLYENCQHQNIKGGDFYVVQFSGIGVGTDVSRAIGLFKTENKELFLQVEHDENGFDISPVEGVNLKKMDKGCLILEFEREKGYMVSVVDKTNSQNASYWVDDFLHLSRRQDAYFQTENIMDLTRNFVAQELPKQFEVTRADQADLLNRSMNYFKNTPRFDLQGFSQQIIGQPQVAQMFDDYRQRYEQERQLELEEQFEVNPTAVKKQNRLYKSVIKLDKNFHIYVHGSRDLIQQGQDESGKFYKIYFNEES